MLLVLHPIFALTAVADAMTGPMLPSLARAFHLSDSQSGALLSCIFAGMASGALLARGDYVRVLTGGLLALSLCSGCFPWTPRTLLYPLAFLLGASIGLPMTAISLFAGRNYPAARASTLALLNFTWSIGATVGPLVAAQLLAVFNWRAVYLVLAGASALSAVIARFTLRDSPEVARTTPETTGLRNLRLVSLFGLFLFLEVGMESMFGAWISTYLLRMTLSSLSMAAAAASVFWAGFLISRGLSPLLLLRIHSGRLLQFALPLAFVAATILVASHSPILLWTAILLLGAALAPVFPVLLAMFFDRARHSSDSRYVLSVSGFGGSVLPWLVGSISSHTGSLRAGFLTGPAVLLLMTAMLPLLSASRPAQNPAASMVGNGHDSA
jgi:fucose permease